MIFRLVSLCLRFVTVLMWFCILYSLPPLYLYIPPIVAGIHALPNIYTFATVILGLERWGQGLTRERKNQIAKAVNIRE